MYQPTKSPLKLICSSYRASASAYIFQFIYQHQFDQAVLTKLSSKVFFVTQSYSPCTLCVHYTLSLHAKLDTLPPCATLCAIC